MWLSIQILVVLITIGQYHRLMASAISELNVVSSSRWVVATSLAFSLNVGNYRKPAKT